MDAAEINALKEKALKETEAASSAENIEAIRIRYLGRKGLLPSIMADLGRMSPEARAEAGKSANSLKVELTAALENKKNMLQQNKPDQQHAAFDYTLPGSWRGIGSKHPISSIIDEVIRIFGRLGFVVADGPDMETSYRNFEALNTPA